jgi:gamma-resorcylate decarboxylase
MKGKIALEEHWAIDETINIAGQPIGAGPFWEATKARLVEFRAQRIAGMDANGIEYAILGLNSPGLQAILDPKQAVEIARRANDTLAEEVAHNPKRFGGFAGLPMQDPEAAARELARCVKELGFKGAMVNCFTQRDTADSAIYYDMPEFRPFFATVAALGVPFYLHPRVTLPSRTKTYEGHRWLYGPAWDFGSETATQALRLMGSGLFDEFPALQVVLGHLGERIPFDMWRIDNLNRNLPVKPPMKRTVSDYMRENIHITTSGQFDDVAFHCALEAVGAARIMFSVDYPYEAMEPAAAWFDKTKLAEDVRRRIGRGNAIKLFKLDLD